MLGRSGNYLVFFIEDSGTKHFVAEYSKHYSKEMIMLDTKNGGTDIVKNIYHQFMGQMQGEIMKVVIEDKNGHIICHYDVISIVDYSKFIVLNTAKFMGKRIPKNKIESVEVIPC